MWIDGSGVSAGSRSDVLQAPAVGATLVADERARLRKAEASTRDDSPACVAADSDTGPEQTGDDDLDEYPQGRPDPTPRESMELLNRQLAQLTECYLRELDDDVGPGAATGGSDKII